MNNKEFLTKLSETLSLDIKEATRRANALIALMTSQLEEQETLAISNFGTFEVKKKLERVVINPSTQQRMLVPPKLVVGFKANPSLRDKANTKTE